MRYIDIGGYVTPKHCIYGPRPAEGIVFNNYEWWSITDHLVKDQREKEIAAVLKAKEEAKKDLSYQMTSKWSNTMASIKTQANQKREEKKQKIIQDRIDQYNAIMAERKEKQKEILKEVRKIMFEQTDAVKTITSAVLHATVLDERRKQIEMKNFLKAKEAKKDEEMVMRIKKDAEDYKREQLEEKLNQKAKNAIQKKYFDEQVAELNLRRQEEKAEFEAQKQDLIKMELEGEKIHQCNVIELEYRKKFAARYMKKTKKQLEYEKCLKLEEDEENEINKIYKDYERKFKKERKQREEKMKAEVIERRQKITEMLAQKLADSAAKEAEILDNSLKAKEEREEREEEERKEKKRQNLQDLLEGKRKAEERQAREEHERKESRKWEMIQNYRRAEINEDWRQSFLDTKQRMMKETREIFDRQCQEKKDIREQELKEMEAEFPNEAAEKEELLNYIEGTMNFVKEENLPQIPVLRAISNIKDEYGFENKDKQAMLDKRNQRIAEQGERRKSKPLGYGCYCFKY